MTLLAIALMWIVGSCIMASEGDYSGWKTIGTAIGYIICIVLFLAFLAATGVGGLFVLVLVLLCLVAFSHT